MLAVTSGMIASCQTIAAVAKFQSSTMIALCLDGLMPSDALVHERVFADGDKRNGNDADRTWRWSEGVRVPIQSFENKPNRGSNDGFSQPVWLQPSRRSGSHRGVCPAEQLERVR